MLAPLSHDQLRNKTVEFKERIADYIKETEDEINGLEKQAAEQPDMEVGQLEQIYSRVDELKKQRNKEIEEVLLEILPEAFAVVKETAKRFTENPAITVTANALDRELAAKKDYVSIDSDKATYLNNWMAAGNRVTWNMIHYDVQLIGCTVLHQGKIAEMATGEGKTLVATLPIYLNALAGKGMHVVTVNDYLALRDSQWMEIGRAHV